MYSSEFFSNSSKPLRNAPISEFPEDVPKPQPEPPVVVAPPIVVPAPAP